MRDAFHLDRIRVLRDADPAPRGAEGGGIAGGRIEPAEIELPRVLLRKKRRNRLVYRRIAVLALRQAVPEDDEQIEIAVRLRIASRAAAKKPDHARAEPHDKARAQEAERGRFAAERSDRAARGIVDQSTNVL